MGVSLQLVFFFSRMHIDCDSGGFSILRRINTVVIRIVCCKSRCAIVRLHSFRGRQQFRVCVP